MSLSTGSDSGLKCFKSFLEQCGPQNTLAPPSQEDGFPSVKLFPLDKLFFFVYSSTLGDIQLWVGPRIDIFPPHGTSPTKPESITSVQLFPFATRGPSWGHLNVVLGAILSFFEPFYRHLSPEIDKVS